MTALNQQEISAPPMRVIHGILCVEFAMLFYAALPSIGLAVVVTIFLSAPLITTFLAPLWPKETIGVHRIGALLVGYLRLSRDDQMPTAEVVFSPSNPLTPQIPEDEMIFISMRGDR